MAALRWSEFDPLDLLTERQLAPLLGVTVRCLQNWRLDGSGPKYAKLGKMVRYRVKDVLEFVEAEIH